MLIDCDTCAVKGAACGNCLVSTLLDPRNDASDRTAEELRAIEVFARAGFEVEVIEEPSAAPSRRPPRAGRSSRPRRGRPGRLSA